MRKTERDYKGSSRELESRQKEGVEDYKNKVEDNVKSLYQEAKCVDFPIYIVLVHSPCNFL